MNKFITYRDSDKNGRLRYFILQKEFPHFVGRISDDYTENALFKVPISGYNLWIMFNGTLRGNVVPSYKDIHKEIEDVFYEMSTWYFTNRISENHKKYSKWLINSNI